MKKISLLSAALLSAGLVACGGGDPKSASDKPDTLFPEGYVPPVITSSSSSAPSNGAKQAIPFHENFDNANNTRAFFAATYKPLNSDAAKPFYYPAGGFVDELGNPSPTATSWITADANRKLRIGNGRLTVGQTKLEVNTTTADTSIPTWGEFDLSKAYKVSFCVVQVSAASSSNFEIYVDNNTTGGNNSIYGAGNASRILQVATHTLVPGTRHEVLVPKAAGDKQIGSATSFFQWRVSSGGFAVIDDIVVEYTGEPHGFTLPACVAENSIAPAPEVAPATPAAPTLIVGDTELVVSWASAGIDATYEVAYGITNDVTAATPFSGNPVTGTTAQLTGLTNGQEYFVWVKAKNVVGSSEYSPSSKATPVAPTGIDPSKEWGFNKLAYQAPAGSSIDVAKTFALGTSTADPSTVVIRETPLTDVPYEADGLNIFLNNGGALRYRLASNIWNFNGHAFASATPVSVVPAVGEVVPALRAYVGVPVVEGRGVTVTFTVKQTGSGQTGIAAIVDQDNRLISATALPYIAPVPENPNAANVAISVTLAEGHTTSELRIFYSRENTGSGGMDVIKLLKSYADSPLEPSSSSSSAASSSVPASSSSEASSSSSSVAPSSSSVDGGTSSSDSSSSSSSVAALPTKTWGFDSAAYAAANTNLFAAAYDAAATNNIKQLNPAVSFDGLIFFNSSTSAVYRLRESGIGGNLEGVSVWNTNGSFFSNNTTMMPAVGADLPSNIRAYIGVPVTPGVATTVTVKFRQTGDATANAAKMALTGSDNKVLAVADATYTAAGTAPGSSVTVSLPSTHTLTDVRLMYGRENISTGGVNIIQIDRVND